MIVSRFFIPCLILFFQAASAQTPTHKGDDTLKMQDLEGVVIVGSRSGVRSKLSTTVPVDVVNTKEIRPFAQTDVAQMLTYTIPSFQSARQTISDGTDHIDPAGLRGLGPDQTLVLLNGRRLHTAALVNINNTVGRGSVGTDLNSIPAAAIERIEIMRDGAAAQYGSDAIAGVINVVLKKNYNGFNISSMIGQNMTTMPYKGGIHMYDGVNQQIDFSGGFAKSNGSYLNISGQFSRRYSTNRSGDDNIPLVYLGNNGNFPTNPYGGAVADADYRRWLMDMDANVVRKQGYSRHNVVAGNSYEQNLSTYLNGGMRLGSNIDFYLTAGMNKRDGVASGFSRNPNAISQEPVLSNGERYYYNGFLPQIAPRIVDWNLLTGFTIKAGNWNIDISNMAGRNTVRYEVKNSGNASLPASDQVQTKFYAGELSFLQNTVNLDISRRCDLNGLTSLNVAFGGELRHETFQITSGEPNSYINGNRIAAVDSIPPFPGTDKWTSFATVVAASGSQVFPGFKDVDAVRASRNIYAAYGDLELTAGKLLLDGAGRFEDYAEQGFSYHNISGKLSARYELSSHFSLRASVSNGFRAPSLHQRYFQNTSTQFVGGQPQNSLTASNQNPIVRNAFGIRELKPETSVSYTLGIVGKLAPGLTVTVDGYFISIKDRIVLSTAFSRTNLLVDTILKANNVDPSTSSLQFWTNAINTETKGIDAVITEKFRLGKGNATVLLAANFNRNSVVGGLHTNSVIDDIKYNPSRANKAANPSNDLAATLFDRQQKGRIETGVPQNKINLTASYNIQRWDFLLRAVRFGKVQFLNNIDPTLVNPNNGAYFNDIGLGVDQIFSAKVTTDVVVSYKAGTGVTLSVGGNNIFDAYPDRIFVDARNDLQTVHGNPIVGANKAPGGYNSARDASNRGRLLFGTNQFGYNGRFLFTRIVLDISRFERRSTAQR
jgi:iron complex outermembrane receptor protein